MESIEIDATKLQNIENFLNPDWISSFVRQFSEWAIVLLYSVKHREKKYFILFVSTHVTLSYFMYSYNSVALSILNSEYGN